MAEQIQTRQKTRALELKVDLEQIGSGEIVDTHMVAAEGLTQQQVLRVLIHVLEALGSWCQEIEEQLAVYVEGGRVT